MGLESIDFQAIVHQRVSDLIEAWKAQGFSEQEVQETANQIFHMGLIAAQQIQQEGGIAVQGSDKKLDYTPEVAQKIVNLFLNGLNAAVMKGHEQRLPSQEMWQFMQNVAYHVFEQGKQAIIATLGQELTPDVQISDDQLSAWLEQTAVEALLYYVTEHEKQNGPLKRNDEPVMPNLLQQEEPPASEPVPQPVAVQQPVAPPVEAPPPEAIQAPVQAPVQAPPPPAQMDPAFETQHKYAAIGLLLTSVPNSKQQKILSAFSAEEQQIINTYRDPERIANTLNLSLVAKYLKAFKAKLGQPKSSPRSEFGSSVNDFVKKLPPQRLDRLFINERPYVRGYIGQLNQATAKKMAPYTLPSGVEESLLLYLQRNFPSEASQR